MKKHITYFYIFLGFLVFLIFSRCQQEENNLKEDTTYVVSFDTNGGENTIISQDIIEGKKADLPKESPKKKGCDFKGWLLNGNLFDFSEPIQENIKLKASWQKQTYLVSFESHTQNGVQTQVIKVEYGSKISSDQVKEPIREGYKFLGWLLDGESFDFERVFDRDVVIISDWVLVHRVSFLKIVGEEPIKVIEIEDGAKIDEENIPEVTRQGYFFKGWLYNNEFRFDIRKEVRSDIYLIALWIEDNPNIPNHTVRFDLNGSKETMRNLILEEGSIIDRSTIKEPYREGYEFVEWQYKESEFDFSTPITEDILLKAFWGSLKEGERNYKVYFNYGHDNKIIHQNITEGTYAHPPKRIPTREGYTFKEWYFGDTIFDFDNTIITEDITLSAFWDPFTYSVFFIQQDGTPINFEDDNGDIVNSVVLEYSSLIPDKIIDKLSPPGSRFLRFMEEDDKQFSGRVIKEIRLIPVWQTSHALVFDVNGGQQIPKYIFKVFEGEIFDGLENQPKYLGHIFNYWKDEKGKEFDLKLPITRDVTLTASWTVDDPNKPNYEITYDPNGGTFYIDKQTVEQGDIIYKPLKEPQADNRIFDKWELDGKEYVFALNPVTKSISLKARWKKLYVITFDTDGGSDIGSMEVSEGITINEIVEYNNPTKNGHLFLGWRDVQYRFFKMDIPINANIKLKAVWQIDNENIPNYKVIFNTLGGTEIESLEVEEGALISSVGKPKKEGHIFIGWKREDGAPFDIDTDIVDEDLKLTVEWNKSHHTITFHIGHGEPNKTIQVEYGKTISTSKIPRPKHQGALFQVWQYQGVNFDFESTIIKADIILEALWVGVNTVDFFSDNNLFTQQRILYGETLNIDTLNSYNPIKPGYVLRGWGDANGVLFDLSIPITQDIILRAIWDSRATTPVESSNSNRYVAAYFSSRFETSPNTNANTRLRETPSYITHIFIGFAKPNMRYTKGSGDISQVGLQFSAYGDSTNPVEQQIVSCTLRQTIDILKGKGIKVILSLGGNDYWADSNSYAIEYQNIKDFVDDFKFDGINWHYEPLGSFDNIGQNVNIYRYVTMIRKSRELMPKNNYIISCSPSGVGALGGQNNNDINSYYAYNQRNNLTSIANSTISQYEASIDGVSFFNRPDTGHMIPIFNQVGDDIDIVSYQGYNIGGSENRTLMYDSYSYYAQRHGFTVLAGVRLPGSTNSVYRYDTTKIASLSAYIYDGGTTNTRLKSNDGIIVRNLLATSGSDSAYQYLKITREIFSGKISNVAISIGSAYNLAPYIGVNNCIAEGTSTTYCGGRLNWLPKSYGAAGEEVYHKGKIWRNKWAAIAIDEPGSGVVESTSWSFVENCNVLLLLSPVNKAVEVSEEPTLTWNNPIISGIDTSVAEYDVYLDQNPMPTTLIVGKLPMNKFRLGKQEKGKTYYWKVKCVLQGRTFESNIASFTVKQEDIKYTVSFNTDEGNTIAPIEVKDGEMVSVSDPIRLDYVFVKWVDEAGRDFNINVSPIWANIRLKAIWKRVRHIDNCGFKVYDASKAYVKGTTLYYDTKIWQTVFYIDVNNPPSEPNSDLNGWVSIGDCTVSSILLTSPSFDEEKKVSLNPVLSWEAPSSLTSDQASNIKYRVLLGTETSPTTEITSDLLGINTYTLTTSLSEDTKYYWKVEGIISEKIYQSYIGVFKTETVVTTSPVLPIMNITSPVFNAENVFVTNDKSITVKVEINGSTPIKEVVVDVSGEAIDKIILTLDSSGLFYTGIITVPRFGNYSLLISTTNTDNQTISEQKSIQVQEVTDNVFPTIKIQKFKLSNSSVFDDKNSSMTTTFDIQVKIEDDKEIPLENIRISINEFPIPNLSRKEGTDIYTSKGFLPFKHSIVITLYIKVMDTDNNIVEKTEEISK